MSRARYSGNVSIDILSGDGGALARSRAGGAKNPSKALFISGDTPGQGVGASAVWFLRDERPNVDAVDFLSSRAGEPKKPSNARAREGEMDECRVPSWGW